MRKMKKQIPIYVISLLGSQRRSMIEEQFSVLNIDFTFFNGVLGSQGHQLFSHYNEKKRLWLKGYPLTKGELGCFASHYLLWEKCVELDRPIIIMEDHALLNDNFSYVVKHANSLLRQDGFYKFNSSDDSTYKVLYSLSGACSVVKFTHSTMFTTGYILTPNCAKQLLEHANEWVYPVDDYMDQEWIHHIPKFGIIPYPASKSNIESEIGQRKDKSHMSVLDRVRCEFLKIPEQIKKKYFFFKLK